ncbi:hypothetical protein SRS16CHR_04884 [Variovorax sp. SRS16]|uniref:hypothetical protein n=1 Tax=Variovorax sp. SRS16 TaxID=282217 RepID=UPI001317E05E|nr:hypothetical protein [Variovorax sp. SRS16]VTU31466.1 hypothetical protein SRS16CHR_04884 [Variovorax sp. SRS16]
MKTLFIPNDETCGSERTHNGARVAGALAKQTDCEVRLFLVGDAAAADHNKRKVPAAFYNLEVMRAPWSGTRASSVFAVPAWMQQASLWKSSSRDPSAAA